MTQHPDSASRYVPIQEEPEEAISSLTPPPEGLGIEDLRTAAAFLSESAMALIRQDLSRIGGKG